METINQRIQIIVDERFGGNKSKLATLAEIKVSTLTNILGPRKTEPSYSVMAKIEKAVSGLDHNWFMYGMGEMMTSAPPNIVKEPQQQYGADSIAFLISELQRKNEIIDRLEADNKAKQIRIDELWEKNQQLSAGLVFNQSKPEPTSTAGGGKDARQAG